MKTIPFSEFVEFWDSNKGIEACSLFLFPSTHSMAPNNYISFTITPLNLPSLVFRGIRMPNVQKFCHRVFLLFETRYHVSGWFLLEPRDSEVPQHSLLPGPPLRLPNYSFPISLTDMPSWSYPSLHLYFKIIFLAGILGPIPTSVVFFLKFIFTSFIEA